MYLYVVYQNYSYKSKLTEMVCICILHITSIFGQFANKK